MTRSSSVGMLRETYAAVEGEPLRLRDETKTVP
jgi:hypothetical protein